MLQLETNSYTDSFWVLPQLPAGVHVWCHKLLHLKSRGNFVSTHLPFYYAVRLLIHGDGIVSFGKEQYKVSAGMMFCTFPGVVIEMKDNPNNPWEWLELQISGEDAESVLQAIGFTSYRPVLHLQNWEAARILRKMLLYYRRKDRQVYKAVSLLCEFINVCEDKDSDLSNKYESNYGRLVALTQSLIETQAKFDMNVNDLARSLGVERSTLFRAFKVKLDMSPSQYLNAKRMESVEDMLSTTELKISQIAAITGFCSDKYFSNWFKNNRGISPAAWRKKQKQHTNNTLNI